MDEKILKKALHLAQKAAEKQEVPVGAVIFDTQTHQIIASAYNQTEKLKNPTAHAEITAIQKACRKLNAKRLNGCSLFVTLEPCAMCAGAISNARLDALYFGAFDQKSGGVCQGARVFEQKQTHHKPQITGGISKDVFGRLLTSFFQQKRSAEK